MHDIGRIFVLLTARERMYGLPFLVVLPQLLDNLSSEDSFQEVSRVVSTMSNMDANLPVAPVTMAVDIW